jgi:DNA (cytosine-5)-methyltransferase 1
VARWIGERLARPSSHNAATDRSLKGSDPWPRAAWGRSGQAFSVDRSSWPVRYDYESLEDFLKFSLVPLSNSATAGFLARTKVSTLRFLPSFLRDVRAHLRRMRRGC